MIVLGFTILLAVGMISFEIKKYSAKGVTASDYELEAKRITHPSE